MKRVLGCLRPFAALLLLAGLVGCGTDKTVETNTVTQTVNPQCNAENPYGVCDAGKTCIAGVCVDTTTLCSPTKLDGVCPAGMTCYAGGCILNAAFCTTTNTNGICADDTKSCLEGACVATASLCGPTNLTGTCGTGQTCFGGGCVLSTSLCTTANPTGPCETGKTCLEGACVQTASLCTSSNPTGQCPAGKTCDKGLCTVPGVDPCTVKVYTTQPTVAARGVATTTATGTITLAGVAAGDTLSIAGQSFAAVAGTPTGSTQFQVGTTDALTAANLAAALNAHAQVKAAIAAEAHTTAVNLSAKTTGVSGNYIGMSSTSSHVTFSGAALSGGSGTGKSVITVEGLQFRDSNGNGTLEKYEDWRYSEICRAQDLATRMTAPQKIGLFSEGGPLGNGVADGTIPASTFDNMVTLSMRDSLVRPGLQAQQSAVYINHLQELAETLPHGVPVAITSDPVHSTSVSMNANGTLSVNPPALFTPWPGLLGLGAINDPQLTWAHADMVRREFMATGFRWELGPMADIATEPRWNRVAGLFGSNALHVARHIRQVVIGFQGSATGDLRNGIAATLKHYPGHGPDQMGMDGHNNAGRYLVYPGNNLDYHLITFQAGFDVGAAAIMPCYGIEKYQYDVNPLQVPSAFSYELITKVAKERQGFKGMVTADWCTLGSCGSIGGNGYNMEGMSLAERGALFLHAGSHQLGNEGTQLFTDGYAQQLISDADVDAAAIKILEMTFKLGLFENPYTDDTQSAGIVKSAANRAMGFEAMKKSIVLLRNGDHAGGSNRYLPINGTRMAGTAYMNDANGNGTVDVYYDGAWDSIVGPTDTSRQDGVTDLYGNYDYTSPAAAGALPVVAATDIAHADIAIIRIAARGGSQTAPTPISFDGTLTPEQLSWGTDTSLAAAAASKKKVLDAFRVRDGYKKSDGTVVAATNPTLKIVLVVYIARPAIVRGFVQGLVSLDELSGQSGSYPSVSDEANIRQAGVTYPAGGGVDAVLMEFGTYDRAVLDFLFNKNVPTGFTYGSARLPMEIPSTDAEVAAQFEDLPDDTYAPTYRQGAGSALQAN